MPKILILIPAFNEEGKIATVIDQIRTLEPQAPILVVDDGSVDDTAAVARRAGATVITHPYNMGYGVTIQTGYKYAWANKFDFVVQLDGDGQHDPSYIPALLDPVIRNETDFALGSRFLSVESYRPSFSRRLGILFFRRLVSILIGRPLTDPTSGFVAFNADVMRFFTSDIFPCDYPDADVLLTLNMAGFRIREIPVRMVSNAQGTTMHSGLRPLYYVFKMSLSIFVTLLRSRRFYRRRKLCR